MGEGRGAGKQARSQERERATHLRTHSTLDTQAATKALQQSKQKAKQFFGTRRNLECFVASSAQSQKVQNAPRDCSESRALELPSLPLATRESAAAGAGTSMDGGSSEADTATAAVLLTSLEVSPYRTTSPLPNG